MTHQFSAMTRLACAAWLVVSLLAGTARAQFAGDGGEFRGGYCGTARFGGWQAERLFAPDANLPAQGPGQLVIRDARSGAWQRLPIARYHVNVVLHAPVALVRVDQTFYNPYFTQHEGVFLFNLPPDASVSRFAMYATPAKLIEGQLPPDRMHQIMALWNHVKQPEQTIAVCERELRRGRPLGDHLPAALHAAYQAVNRPIDAHRAATEP